MRFTFNPSKPYQVRCINPACGRRYEAHWPATHTHCSLACILAYEPTAAERQVWLERAAQSREKKKGGNIYDHDRNHQLAG